MENYDILEKLRENIDNVDNEILILLKRRFQTSKKILQHKQKKEMEIFQPDRETDIIMDKCSKATRMDLNETFVRELFQKIIEESKVIQENEIKKQKNKL